MHSSALVGLAGVQSLSSQLLPEGQQMVVTCSAGHAVNLWTKHMMSQTGVRPEVMRVAVSLKDDMQVFDRQRFSQSEQAVLLGCSGQGTTCCPSVSTRSGCAEALALVASICQFQVCRAVAWPGAAEWACSWDTFYRLVCFFMEGSVCDKHINKCMHAQACHAAHDGRAQWLDMLEVAVQSLSCSLPCGWQGQLATLRTYTSSQA